MNTLKKIVSTGFIAVGLAVAGVAHADGYHVPGTVSINPDYSMSGAFNVRYNTSVAGDPYIYIQVIGGTIFFMGRDSQNVKFGCYVSESSPLYATAREIFTGSLNGSYIRLNKNPGEGPCSSIWHERASFYMD